MFRTFTSLAAFVALWLAASGTPVTSRAADAKGAAKSSKTEAKTDARHDAMAAEVMKYAMPGPAHEKLKSMEGKWKAVHKAWFAPGEPTVSEGTSENRLILGGRWLEQRFKGTFMGQPFEGYGLTGYDNKKATYTTVWIDNTSTSVLTSDGAMDDAAKELTFRAKSDGPDGSPMEMKMVTRMVDANRHVWSMYGTVEGKEQLMMEITYTRI